jgi:hypothetical protein
MVLARAPVVVVVLPLAAQVEGGKGGSECSEACTKPPHTQNGSPHVELDGTAFVIIAHQRTRCPSAESPHRDFLVANGQFELFILVGICSSDMIEDYSTSLSRTRRRWCSSAQKQSRRMVTFCYVGEGYACNN